MGLEAATYINQLNAANPVGAVDPKAQGDDHLRLIKSTLQASFPNITGAMTRTQAELNAMAASTGFATPTSDVDLAAETQGVATTVMRSDAKLQLSQAIAPAWTGQHSWTLNLRAPDGAVGTPAFTFANDLDTGIYRAGGNNLAIAAGGVSYIDILAGSAMPVRFLSGQAGFQDGTAPSPGIAFFNDPDTGFRLAGTNRVDVITAGASHLAINDGAGTSTIDVQKGTLRVPDGTVAAPTYSFSSDSNTGMLRGGSDDIRFAAGGVFALGIQNSAGAVFIYTADGSAANPAYTFGAIDCGIYRRGANSLGFSEAGVGYQIGYRNLPVSATATTLAIGDVGKCVDITAAINIPASVFAAGDIVSIYNNSAGALNITISAGTLRLAGTATTGTRSLPQRKTCTLWFRTGGATPEVICEGAN